MQDRRSIFQAWANKCPSPEIDIINEWTGKYAIPNLKRYFYDQSDQSNYYYHENDLTGGTNHFYFLPRSVLTLRVSRELRGSLQYHKSRDMPAPQLSLTEDLILRLRQSSLQNKPVIDKNWYLLWDEVLQTVLRDKNTDPVIKCIFIDLIFRQLSNIEPYFFQYEKLWEYQRTRSGFRISTNWANSNRPEIQRAIETQRVIASNLLKTFPFDNITEGINNTSVFPIRFPQPAAVEYAWGGIVASDETGAYIILSSKAKRENLNDETWYFLNWSSVDNPSSSQINPSNALNERYMIKEIGTIKPQSDNIERIPLPQSYLRHVGSPVYLKHF